MMTAIATMVCIMLPNVSAEPAAQNAPADSLFIVGQDASGQWLAIDTTHRGGGLFKSRTDALHFAAFESGHRPDCIRVSAVPLHMEF